MVDIRIGIIGAGYWGPNLARNFNALENCEVKYICDLDKNKLEKIRSNYPHAILTQKAEDIFLDQEVDAVAIATPVFTHHTLALSALKHGKHVFLEKPMASSVQECEELITEAKQRELLLMVDHTFLYTGAVRKIKELIDQGELGELYYFDSERINLGLIQPDINVIWDLAPHDISIMNYIFTGARPVSVFATGANHITQKVQEMAHVTIHFDTGVVGHIHVSWLSPVKIRKVLVGGSKQMVMYNDLEPSEKIKVYDKGLSLDLSSETPMSPVYRSGDIFIPKLDGEEALKREAKHFINCLNGAEEPLVDGVAGMEVVRILEACDMSMKEGRQINL